MTDRVDAKAALERWRIRRYEWPAMGELWTALSQTLTDPDAAQHVAEVDRARYGTRDLEEFQPGVDEAADRKAALAGEEKP